MTKLSVNLPLMNVAARLRYEIEDIPERRRSLQEQIDHLLDRIAAHTAQIDCWRDELEQFDAYEADLRRALEALEPADVD